MADMRKKGSPSLMKGASADAAVAKDAAEMQALGAPGKSNGAAEPARPAARQTAGSAKQPASQAAEPAKPPTRQAAEPAARPSAPGDASEACGAPASGERSGLTPAQKSRELNELFSATFDSVQRIEEHALDNRLTAGLTISELHTIAAIGLHGSKPMTAIASQLHVTLATVTAAVNKLEKKGFVERRRNPDDRRQVLVSLTGTGRRACRVHDMFHQKMVARALSSMDDAQTDALMSALQHLVDFFNEEATIAQENLAHGRPNPSKPGAARRKRTERNDGSAGADAG